MAEPRYKQMLVDSTADDVLLTCAFTGLQTNILRPSIVAAGLDPKTLPDRGPINIAKDIDVIAREERPKRWRDIWSAGHSTSGVTRIDAAADLIEQTLLEYNTASAAERC
jgi:nitronate monooxygenase